MAHWLNMKLTLLSALVSKAPGSSLLSDLSSVYFLFKAGLEKTRGFMKKPAGEGLIGLIRV